MPGCSRGTKETERGTNSKPSRRLLSRGSVIPEQELNSKRKELEIKTRENVNVQRIVDDLNKVNVCKKQACAL
jgi:hypothetical protein